MISPEFVKHLKKANPNIDVPTLSAIFDSNIEQLKKENQGRFEDSQDIEFKQLVNRMKSDINFAFIASIVDEYIQLESK